MDLDKITRENRFTISVVFPLVGAITLLASVEGIMPDFLSYNSLLIISGTLIMRLPLIAGIKPVLDRKLLAGLGVLVAYSYVIEFIGVNTGFPYGSFEYGIDLGPMLFEKIPLALPIFFIPLVINSYMLILLLSPEKSKRLFYRLPLVIGTVLILDLILDPAAVAINFWNYESGFYYGVPLSNYLGWVLSASVAVFVLDLTLDREKLLYRLESCAFMLDDLVSFVLLWSIINFYFLQVIPLLFSGVLGLALWHVDRFDFALPNYFPKIPSLERIRFRE